jgi:hypothetical protein
MLCLLVAVSLAMGVASQLGINAASKNEITADRFEVYGGRGGNGKRRYLLT